MPGLVGVAEAAQHGGQADAERMCVENSPILICVWAKEFCHVRIEFCAGNWGTVVQPKHWTVCASGFRFEPGHECFDGAVPRRLFFAAQQRIAIA